MDFKDFRGKAKRLDDVDLPVIAARIGVGEDELHAIMDVEAAGSGFDSSGRPRMRPEPHIFWRELPPKLRDQAARAGLASPKYGAIKVGAESGYYPRLFRMLAIDETAALRSCSWGRGQIMGFNCRLAGYDTPQEMVLDFMEDEENHIEAMVQFIVNTKLDDEVRRHDWAGFARGYNGPNYRDNRYDVKLAERFAWWQRKPDTPMPPARDVPTFLRRDDAPAARLENVEGAKVAEPRWIMGELHETAGEPLLAEGVAGELATGDLMGSIDPERLSPYAAEALQARLRELGVYIVGKVDGDAGSSVVAGLAKFQRARGIPVTGMYDAATREQLKIDKPVPVPAARAATTKDDLRAQGSKIVLDLDDAKSAAKVGGGLLTAAGTGKVAADSVPDVPPAADAPGGILPDGVLDTARQASELWYYVAPLKAAFASIPWLLLAIALVVLLWFVVRKMTAAQDRRVEDERIGLHNGEPDPSPSPPVEYASDRGQRARTAARRGIKARG